MSETAGQPSWIKDLITEWKSKTSAVLTVHTADPDREAQLISYLLSEFHQVFVYDPWNGLLTCRRGEPKLIPVTKQASGDIAAYDNQLDNTIREQRVALEHMQPLLANRKAALVLRRLERDEQTRQDNRDLQNALRAWALSPALLASDSLVCLVAAQPLSVVDPATLDLTCWVHPELSTPDERRQLIRRLDGKLSGDELEKLVLSTGGLSLHQARSVLQKTYHATARFDLPTVKHHKAEYIRRSETLEIEEPQKGFAEVGGYDNVKQFVREKFINVLHQQERARRFAVPLPRGLLLYGPPGTGKTLFARALAKETNLPFIQLRTENLFRKFLGESAQRLQEAIRLAEQSAPALVFVDEIDRFGARGDGGGDGASQESSRVFSQILEWLGDEKRRTIIVGTTNAPDRLDEAFVRPGRFDYCVPLLYPDKNARLQILRIHLGLGGNLPKPALNEREITPVLVTMAQQTEYFSGADLELLVTRAKLNGFNDAAAGILSREHFLAALQDYRIDTETRRKQVDNYRQLGPAFATSLALLDGE